jgi:hypothetical protein
MAEIDGESLVGTMPSQLKIDQVVEIKNGV